MNTPLDPNLVTELIYSQLLEVKRLYEQNERIIAQCELELTDLTHLAELVPLNALEGYKLANRIAKNRKRRRVCKDHNRVMQPLYELLRRQNGQILHDTKRAAADSAKNKKGLQERYYKPRSETVSAAEFKNKSIGANHK